MAKKPPSKLKRKARGRAKPTASNKRRAKVGKVAPGQSRSAISVQTGTNAIGVSSANTALEKMATEVQTPVLASRQASDQIEVTARRDRETEAVRDLALATRSHAGLDTGSFPGLGLLSRWFRQCPYTWLGYYLNSPCHTATRYRPWMGNWRSLIQQGWGLAIIYVGHQVNGCGADQLSRVIGEAHGQATISLMGDAEQLPNGCVVFLDVEPFDSPIPTQMSDYVRGWVRALLVDGRFKPGIYCHTRNANDILLTCEQEYSDAGVPDGRPLFWVSHPTNTFDLATSSPSDSGVRFADIWQGKANSTENYNNLSLLLDENVSLLGNPSSVHLVPV
jgi:hypothetical protein